LTLPDTGAPAAPGGVESSDAAPVEGRAVPSFAEVIAPYDVPPKLLRQALSHRSFCAETPSQPSNERLELLGDAVLGLVVADHLYSSFPELPEGDLARVRAAVVSTTALAPVARALGIGPELLLGRGEESSGGRAKASILADSFEAVIGAVWLAAGFEAARRFVLGLLEPYIAEVASEARLGDPKNRLQELSVQLMLGMPSYVMTERGPDHAKHFVAEAVVAGERLGTGDGTSKKDAERRAAEAALAVLRERAAGGAERSARQGGSGSRAEPAGA
jgi:ribonuclease III